MFRRRNQNPLRLVSLLGVAAYLVALFAPIAHADAFGVEPHEHDGHPCYVLDLVETAGPALTSAGVDVPVLYFLPVVLSPVSLDVFSTSRSAPYASRAPPA